MTPTLTIFSEVNAGRMTVEQGADVLEQLRAAERRELFWRRLFAWVALVVVVLVMFGAVQAFAQAGDAPHAAPAPTVSQPVQIVPIVTPAVAAPAETGIPSSAWLGLLVMLGTAALAWYQKYLSKPVHAKLDAIVADPTKSKVVRTLAEVADDLEPLIVSAAGHVGHDVATADDGADLHQLATTAAGDLVDGLDVALKTEATKFFGAAGGGLVDFIVGAIKAKVMAAQGAGAAAAAAVDTTAKAAAVLDKA